MSESTSVGLLGTLIERLIAFCDQTANDGIQPSLAWFKETAADFRAALPPAPPHEQEAINAYNRRHGNGIVVPDELTLAEKLLVVLEELRVASPPAQEPQMELAKICERLCRFNCDAESWCGCEIHRLYRASVVVAQLGAAAPAQEQEP